MKPNWIVVLAAALAVSSIAGAQAVDSTSAIATHGQGWHGPAAQRVVYTQTNAADGNEVLVFRRNSRGDLDHARSVKTHGLGTGAGLGSQGALALSRSGDNLYVVNAGSDSISVFLRAPRGLVLIQRVRSGGDQPISLTLHHDLLYVLNAGAVSNIRGFRVGHGGRLHALSGSTRPLSGGAVMPAQVQFNNTGDFLVVTEKATNRIDLYAVEDGVASGPFVRNANGATPFGFAFDRRDHLIVSEAFPDVPNGSATSSYDFDAADAPLQVLTGSLQAGQTAACWVVTTRNGRYAYVSNTGSGTLTGLRTARSGQLSLLQASGVSGRTGDGSMPQDMALSRRNDFLFVLTPGTGTVQSFKVASNGALRHVSTANGVPASAQGLAAN